MGTETILSANQWQVLTAIANERTIRDSFYLTGGTALAEYYLHHRYSEDLDFFSETEFDPQTILVILKKLKRAIEYETLDYEQSFNRNLFFLHFGREVVKAEFTFFPFPRIEKRQTYTGLAIDSLMDIAVNKLFTIYQKPRARDYIDLYAILLSQKRWTIAGLIKKAKIKFDWHVDPIQLGSQFLQAEVVKDYPRMIQGIKPVEWQGFFVAEAKNMREDIVAK